MWRVSSLKSRSATRASSRRIVPLPTVPDDAITRRFIEFEVPAAADAHQAPTAASQEPVSEAVLTALGAAQPCEPSIRSAQARSIEPLRDAVDGPLVAHARQPRGLSVGSQSIGVPAMLGGIACMGVDRASQ